LPLVVKKKKSIAGPVLTELHLAVLPAPLIMYAQTGKILLLTVGIDRKTVMAVTFLTDASPGDRD
jgi:hypothetical protein